MKKLHPALFAPLTLPLLLAACGTPAAPTASVPAKLVKLALHAPVGALKAQGLPTGVSAMHFNVHVRDSQNKLMTFQDGTYDPSGQGSTTLSLNSQNAYAQTVLLPEGNYTFENAVKDDATGSALLAYGPAEENAAAVSADTGAVMLKFHAVYDPASSRLDFAANTPHLRANTTFNLGLFAKSSPVDGVSAKIPTSDLGAVTYSIGEITDGTLNTAGSKLGVNVTSLGTTADPVMDVHASFSAWLRDGEGDTASFVPTGLDFSKLIEMDVALKADAVMPVAVLNETDAAVVGGLLTLSGTATDDTAVSSIKLYDNMSLVASTDEADGVAVLSSDESGHWTANWTPATKGDHELTLVVTDSSGNESRSTHTATAEVQNYDQEMNYADGGNSRNYSIPAHSESWIKVNTNGWTGGNYIYTQQYLYGPSTNCFSTYTNDSNIIAVTYGTTQVNQIPMSPQSCYAFSNYNILPNTSTYFIHIVNKSDYEMNEYVSASAYYD